MPLGRPHPYASEPHDLRRKRPLPSSKSATTSNKRVSFGQGSRLVRGPSPACSGQRTRAADAHNIVNSSDDAGTDVAGTDDDGPSQQIRDEDSAMNDLEPFIQDPIGHGYERSRERSRPVTEAYEQQEAISSLKIPQTAVQTLESEADQDEEVCRRVHKLRAQIIDFAQAYVCDIKESKRHSPSVEYLCSNVNNAKLVRYIGYLAQGGASGLDSWKELLTDEECLTALVVGIVGSALKEHVFSALWFGGNTTEIDLLQECQERQKEEDGYERTKTRVATCNGFERDSLRHTHVAAHIAVALRKLLTPLLRMSKRPGSPPRMSDELCDDLLEIVADAGRLSREIRMCADVIYHWSPTFKDEEFDPERMECLNTTSMIKNNPYEIKEKRSVLKGATEKSEAIVRITAFPGLVAHRKGGGLLAKDLLAEEKRKDRLSEIHLPPDVKRSRDMHPEKKFTGKEGFRTRVICKSVVHLQWGQQRLLTKEAGTSRHLDAMRYGGMAKYEEDRRGFVELFDYFLEVHPDFDRESS